MRARRRRRRVSERSNAHGHGDRATCGDRHMQYVRVRRCDVCTPSAVSAVPALSDSRTSLHCTHTDARLGAPAISLSRSPAQLQSTLVSSSGSVVVVANTNKFHPGGRHGTRLPVTLLGRSRPGAPPTPHLPLNCAHAPPWPCSASGVRSQAPSATPRGDRKQLYVPTADATPRAVSAVFFLSCHCPIYYSPS